MSETLSTRQLKFMLILFCAGSTIIIGASNNSKSDAWIAIISAIIMAIPLVIMYARIIKLNPGESLFDISINLFGKIIGTIINILMTWYALHLGALVLANFTKFIGIAALLDTPQILISIVLLLVVAYIGKSGIMTFGKWSTITLPLILIIISITLIISIPSVHLEHILPIMGQSFNLILSDSVNDFGFPFGETVLFLCLGCFIKKDAKPYKIYIYGIIISGIIMLIVFLRNLTVLGPGMMESSYFPSFTAARVVGIGEFLTRIEGFVTINFIFAGITKISVCLIVIAKGISKIINVTNYKDLVIPSTLLVLMISIILYKSTLEMYDFLKVYTIYAFPFQVIIPLTIWIASEIKNRKGKVSTRLKSA